MLNILLVIQIIIAILLITVILLQRTGADGISALSGGNNMGLVSARTAANFLTRLTMVLAAVFMINSLVLANLSSKSNSSSISKELENKAHSDAAEAPEVTSMPIAP